MKNSGSYVLRFKRQKRPSKKKKQKNKKQNKKPTVEAFLVVLPMPINDRDLLAIK